MLVTANYGAYENRCLGVRQARNNVQYFESKSLVILGFCLLKRGCMVLDSEGERFGLLV